MIHLYLDVILKRNGGEYLGQGGTWPRYTINSGSIGFRIFGDPIVLKVILDPLSGYSL